MIKFEYEINGLYIHVRSTWDGQFDNDPLTKDLAEGTIEQRIPNSIPHPFSRTIDYEEEQEWYEFQKSQANPDGYYRTYFIGEKIEISPEEIEKSNPENIREWKEVVAVNSATLAICELLSNKQKLMVSSGNIHPYWYWMKLSKALSGLWD